MIRFWLFLSKLIKDLYWKWLKWLEINWNLSVESNPIRHLHMKPIPRDVVLRQTQLFVSLLPRYTSVWISKPNIVHLVEYERTSDSIFLAASNPHLELRRNFAIRSLKINGNISETEVKHTKPNEHWIVEASLCEIDQHFRQCGAEHDHLLWFRQPVQCFIELLAEPHFEESIGFVENDIFCREIMENCNKIDWKGGKFVQIPYVQSWKLKNIPKIEIKNAQLTNWRQFQVHFDAQMQKPTWCGDNDIRTCVHCLKLWVNWISSEHKNRL